eukprot:752636-Hanusia_phi.AAC.1
MARVTWRKLRLGVTRWQLIGGSLLGLFVGLMVGIMIGAPMALVTYGSITDAIVNNQDKTFSLDKNKTDIPGVVLANRVKEHWGLAVAYIWKQFYMSVGVGAAVGLGHLLDVRLNATLTV